MSQIKWSCITREERFFTRVLFHDLLHDVGPFWELLNKQLRISSQINIDDIGYEVCYFRDAFHAGLISPRQPQLEKQTFDLVLWLSDDSLVIIEAKAQQGFHMDQIKALQESCEIILEICLPVFPITKVYIAGLCSSKYSPKESTYEKFNALIRWNEISKLYPGHINEYNRADRIYHDTPNKSVVKKTIMGK